MTTPAVKERPILFSAPMVKAILSGSKTQTRRVVKPQPPLDEGGYDYYDHLTCEFYEPTIVGRDGEERPGKEIFGCHSGDGEWGIKCQYEPGMRLWVRETWAEADDCEYGIPCIAYRAGGGQVVGADGSKEAGTWREYLCGEIDGDFNVEKWRPSIFMPRWASRITLEITEVRVERLQDISEADAMAEGMPQNAAIDCRPGYRNRELFQELWDRINGKKHPFASNPWVWAIEFKIVEESK